MVVIRPRSWLVLLICLMSLPLQVCYAASLKVSASQTRVELGKAFSLRIQGSGLEQELQQLDLSVIKNIFKIASTEYTNKESKKQQTLILKLYPRQTGAIHIPALIMDKIRSAPLKLDVVDGMVNGEAISLNFQLPSTRIWERQQIIINVEVLTPDQFASLRGAEPRLPGFETIPLPASRDWISSEGKRRTRLRIGWLLFPLDSGNQRIELPAISYHLGGTQRRTYYLPPITLQVRPLPPYIPPTIPAGKVSLSSKVEPGGLLRTDNLGYWTIHMQSDALLPVWFPPVLRQIKSTEHIHYFPANSERRRKPDIAGIHSQVMHRIAFKPLANGNLALPTLQVQYFDPDNGKLIHVTHRPARPLVLSTHVLVLSAILLLAGGYLAVTRVLQYLKKQWQRKKKTDKALTQIQNARTTEELHRALMRWANANGWPRNITLTEWKNLFQTYYQPAPGFDRSIKQLSKACYGRDTDNDIEKLRQPFLAYLTSPKRRRRKENTTSGFDPWQVEYLALPPDRADS